MKCLYQLNSPTGQKPMYRCLAASKDSRMLVAAGRLSFFFNFILLNGSLFFVFNMF